MNNMEYFIKIMGTVILAEAQFKPQITHP